MKILLWHGWLLTGSGSNVYAANVARSWRAAGHAVLILCQDREAHSLDFIDGAGDFDPENLVLEVSSVRRDDASGSCLVARPDLGGLLPVFVYDDYVGFEVKRFIELSDTELDEYVRRNVAALVTATESFRPDVIITGHEVMGPEIARRAGEITGQRYVAYLHGSGLEYAVKLQERYKSYCLSGLEAANRVVGGSNYMVQAAGSVVPGTWEDNAVVVNPGCDVDLFRPMERYESQVPTVGFVGKLIVSKGIHNFIASVGLVENDFEAVIVGYGGFEDRLHQLAAALKAGDIQTARRIAIAGDGTELSHLATFLEHVPVGYVDRMSEIPIRFTGRLEHGPLSKLLPTFDVLVVPSVLPEAFGMVAAEAAACGVLPVVPDHSGISEAGAPVEEAIGAPGLLTYDSGDPIEGIATCINRLFAVPLEVRREMGHAAARLARERWSWQGVSAELLRVSQK